MLDASPKYVVCKFEICQINACLNQRDHNYCHLICFTFLLLSNLTSSVLYLMILLFGGECQPETSSRLRPIVFLVV